MVRSMTFARDTSLRLLQTLSVNEEGGKRSMKDGLIRTLYIEEKLNNISRSKSLAMIEC
uniref:Uncharacterized protein n=1 Tax=Onchocerca volvulus TaxID=6282 RepID=A0A8R1TV63_ONCVO